jgi:two-component system response regulator FlrC
MATCRDIAVLIVDDDASFRSGVADNLADDGHVVYHHATPAVTDTEHLDAADVVVTHYYMREADGITFADKIQRARGGVPVLLVTAYWTVEVEAAAAMRPHVHLCRRPIDYDDLHERIHSVALGGGSTFAV